MDINSASPDAVLPLPFHAMKTYPYAESDVPPAAQKAFQDAEHWNTRLVMRSMAPIDLHVSNAQGTDVHK